MDRQSAVDRILETENLTDELEDDDANTLLDWGTAHVDAAIVGAADDDEAGKRVNALMALMRGVNALMADRTAKPPDALAAVLGDLRAQYAALFGVSAVPSGTATSVQSAPDTVSLATLSSADALAAVLAAIQAPPATTPASAEPSAPAQAAAPDTQTAPPPGAPQSTPPQPRTPTTPGQRAPERPGPDAPAKENSR